MKSLQMVGISSGIVIVIAPDGIAITDLGSFSWYA